MVVGSLFKIAIGSLWANKLRSSLTLVGVIFGVTSVMTIISALEGMMGEIKRDLEVLGPSTFVVQRIGIAMSEEEFLKKLRRKPLEPETAEMIKQGSSNIEAVSARAFTRARVKYRDEAMRSVSLRGGSAKLIDIAAIPIEIGRFHMEEESASRRRVAFIGPDLRDDLFDEGVDCLGKTIKINGQPFTVVGVAKKRGSAFGGDNQDRFVEIPMTTYQKMFGKNNSFYALIAKADSVQVLDQAMDEARMVLRAKRHVPYNEEDDFDILTADNILEVLNQVTRLFRLGLIGISSISLVVGGIVVMNIMMVSVSERTREIGIRKAIGAKRNHILVQFLFESLVVTLGGGAIGIIGGYLIADWLMSLIDMQISPSMFAILAGLVISISTGLFFGIYPALRAARLDPVRALSYE
jgi:putative ABC transport system permease protein